MRSLTQLISGVSKAIGIGIAGAVLYGAVSCDEALFPAMTEAQKTTLAGSALIASSKYSNNPKDARNAETLGSLLTIYGQMQHDLEVAKAGKTEVTVNNSYESTTRANSLESRTGLPPFNTKELEKEWNETNSTGIGVAFTCNWHNDFDGNGLSFDDFKGIKRTFNRNEKIELVGFYAVDLYTFKRKEFPVKIDFTIRFYRKEDGKLLGEEKQESSYPKSSKSLTIYKVWATAINPNTLPPGGYVYEMGLKVPSFNNWYYFDVDAAALHKSGEFEIIK